MKFLLACPIMILCLTASTLTHALEPPTDPLYTARGEQNQWALERIGLDSSTGSGWRQVPSNAPVLVAVIDSGLDWNHLDIDWNKLWRNEREVPDNGQDDDGNGYIDDLIGYNFIGGNNKPWDHDGHGTFVTGLIAATWNNGAGIAGVNPNAKIMVLKALNSFGHTRASYVAEALVYAANHNAKIINMSLGGEDLTTLQRKAVDYALDKGALIVIAAGNEGRELKGFGIAELPGVITVGASDRNDKRAAFSNFGPEIDLVAPGIDIVSLRARYTDTLRDIPGTTYRNSSAYVGKDKRYYMAGGTSFSAPIVSGVASLLLSKDPSLSAADLKRILENSARDIETPGRDNLSGAGLIDVLAALKADKNFFIEAVISGVRVVQGADGQPMLEVLGTASANALQSISIAIGAGESPASFITGSKSMATGVTEGVVGIIPAAKFAGSTVWTLKLIVRHQNGATREARFRLQVG